MSAQSMVDRLAVAGEALLGNRMELVTFYAKSSPTASPVTHANITVALEEYTLHELSVSELLLTDRKCRIASFRVSWTPTQYDEFVRTDGTRWRILSGTEGTRRPWTILPARQVA